MPYNIMISEMHRFFLLAHRLSLSCRHEYKSNRNKMREILTMPRFLTDDFVNIVKSCDEGDDDI
jgi:hypothetical protein